MCAGRRPPASSFGWPGTSEKPAPRLCSRIPVSGSSTHAPNAWYRLWVSETASPESSAATTATVSPVAGGAAAAGGGGAPARAAAASASIRPAPSQASRENALWRGSASDLRALRHAVAEQRRERPRAGAQRIVQLRRLERGERLQEQDA